LAKVRFLTRPCSRKLSRNRTAGGEPRLATASIYRAPRLALYDAKWKRNILYYMATMRPQEGRGRRRKPWLLCPRKQKLRARGALRVLSSTPSKIAHSVLATNSRSSIDGSSSERVDCSRGYTTHPWGLQLNAVNISSRAVI
jgi:hypothetical protein